jgi:hypothetical protein
VILERNLICFVSFVKRPVHTCAWYQIRVSYLVLVCVTERLEILDVRKHKRQLTTTQRVSWQQTTVVVRALLSKHVSGLGTNKNMVMGSDGARNQERLCWRRPAAYHSSSVQCRVNLYCSLISWRFKNIQPRDQSLLRHGRLEREHLLTHPYEEDHRKKSDTC